MRGSECRHSCSQGCFPLFSNHQGIKKSQLFHKDLARKTNKFKVVPLASKVSDINHCTRFKFASLHSPSGVVQLVGVGDSLFQNRLGAIFSIIRCRLISLRSGVTLLSRAGASEEPVIALLPLPIPSDGKVKDEPSGKYLPTVLPLPCLKKPFLLWLRTMWI